MRAHVKGLLSVCVSVSAAHLRADIMTAFFFTRSDRSERSAKNAPIDLINLQKRTLQITLLFGHTHTTHNAVKYINVCVNIYDVVVVL